VGDVIGASLPVALAAAVMSVLLLIIGSALAGQGESGL
jgi:hypothetical protein